jgi:capsular exopolysaccharide synthesis family protein
MVTSSQRDEGKTTAATHLALTAARYGTKKVVLVDLDLRRPRIHSVTGLPQKQGVVDVLRGELPIESTFKSTPLPNLTVMTSGRALASPSGLLDSPALGAMLSSLKQKFELVIVDAPPSIPVTDPMLIGPQVDATLLVVMAGEVPRQVVRRAAAMIKDSGARLLGVIVNNLDEVLPYYYDYNYYGYETTPTPPGGDVAQVKEPK